MKIWQREQFQVHSTPTTGECGGGSTFNDSADKNLYPVMCNDDETANGQEQFVSSELFNPPTVFLGLLDLIYSQGMNINKIRNRI